MKEKYFKTRYYEDSRDMEVLNKYDTRLGDFLLGFDGYYYFYPEPGRYMVSETLMHIAEMLDLENKNLNLK